MFHLCNLIQSMSSVDSVDNVFIESNDILNCDEKNNYNFQMYHLYNCKIIFSQ